MTQNTVQSAYNRYMSVGAAGAFADMSDWDADTYQAEGTIPFGYAVSKGAAVRGAVVGGTLFVGIAVRDVTLLHSTPDQYQIYDSVAVATKGDIYVLALENVVARTAVKYKTSDGRIGYASGTAIDGAVWMTTTSAGSIGVVRLSHNQGDLTT